MVFGAAFAAGHGSPKPVRSLLSGLRVWQEPKPSAISQASFDTIEDQLRQQHEADGCQQYTRDGGLHDCQATSSSRVGPVSDVMALVTTRKEESPSVSHRAARDTVIPRPDLTSLL